MLIDSPSQETDPMKKLVLLLICTISLTSFSWELTDKNSHITDMPTLYDFMPLDIIDVVTNDYEVLFPVDDPQCSFR